MNINKELEYEKKPAKKNQENWIEHFNSKWQKMISAPDIYSVVKNENKELIKSLKKDFKKSRVVTSTRIAYNKDNLNAEIIHNADSTIVKAKRYNVKVPIFDRDEAREDSETESYLQTLFDTKDKISTILKVLKRFDNNIKIYLWTPSQSSRAGKQVRSVGFGFGGFGRFGICGNDWFDGNGGVSRGVRA